MKIRIKIDKNSSNTLFINQSMLEEFGLKESEKVNLLFGIYERKVQVQTQLDLDQSDILISNDVLSNVTIPENITYELVLKNKNSLLIGPVLGILIKGTQEDLVSKNLNIYLNYVVNYQNLNGIVVLFTSDGILIDEKSVKGYTYNPDSNSWEKGVFPFPSAIFCRKQVKKKWQKTLSALVGNRYFNSKIFNKWDMWELLSKNKFLLEFLPETILANDQEKLNRFIDKHTSIFVKPKSGMQGTGIFLLEANEKSYSLKYRIKKQNIISNVESKAEGISLLFSMINPENYLAQQSIKLIEIDNCVSDFRVIVQKNHTGSFIVPGMITRFGKKNSIVSNISSGGSAEKTWNTLIRFFNGDFQKAYQKYKEIEFLAVYACSWLENLGLHLGNIGMDIGMDQNAHLWIIEINSREPDMTIALDANDHHLYYQLKAAPLEYAKWLADFRGETYV